MTKSKKYGWQKLWTLDGPTARHECGMVCELRNGAAVAQNWDETIAALAVKNGPHNAPKMAHRLVNEATTLLLGGRSYGEHLDG